MGGDCGGRTVGRRDGTLPGGPCRVGRAVGRRGRTVGSGAGGFVGRTVAVGFAPGDPVGDAVGFVLGDSLGVGLVGVGVALGEEGRRRVGSMVGVAEGGPPRIGGKPPPITISVAAAAAAPVAEAANAGCLPSQISAAAITPTGPPRLAARISARRRLATCSGCSPIECSNSSASAAAWCWIARSLRITARVWLS